MHRPYPRSARSLLTVLTAAAVVLPSAAASAAPSWKTAEQPAEESPTDLLPVIHDAIVDDLGSLYEVTGALGLNRSDAPTGDGVGIAIIDTGLVDVPALRHARITIGPDFSLDAGGAPGKDLHGHGTHLASLIASSDEAWRAGDHTRLPGRQIGVAPDADLVSVKVGAANGAVDVTQVIAAINWVIDNRAEHNIRVLSLSYGTDSTQDWRIDPLSHAVERAWHAGIAVIVASGNAGQQATSFVNPATNPWIIVAGAADHSVDGGWVDWSGHTVAADFSSGTDATGVSVNLTAPGRSIIGARVPGSLSDQHNHAGRIDDDLVRGTGSSQAAALIAGATAALLEHRPELTPDELKQVLHFSGRSVDGADRVYEFAAFVDVLAAEGERVRKTVGGYDRIQQHERSTGTGSIDAARGTQRLAFDGAPISGEVDVFGNDHGATAWTTDSFSGFSWNGVSWNGYSWNGDAWEGVSWNQDVWSGVSWNGVSWNTESWEGVSWNGYSWNGVSWNGYSWNGVSWNGYSWNGSDFS